MGKSKKRAPLDLLAKVISKFLHAFPLEPSHTSIYRVGNAAPTNKSPSFAYDVRGLSRYGGASII